MIKEPEAAALYTIRSLDCALTVGDAFVLCDAGGGTVDLISYEIVSLHPLQVKELVPGTGGMAGSLGLNKRFEQKVKEILGPAVFRELREEKGYGIALQRFDREVKPAFRGGMDEEYYVNFPMVSLDDNVDENLESGCWTVTG